MHITGELKIDKMLDKLSGMKCIVTSQFLYQICTKTWKIDISGHAEKFPGFLCWCNVKINFYQYQRLRSKPPYLDVTLAGLRSKPPYLDVTLAGLRSKPPYLDVTLAGPKYKPPYLDVTLTGLRSKPPYLDVTLAD